MKYFIDFEWGLVIICVLYISMHSDLSVHIYIHTHNCFHLSYLLTYLPLPPPNPSSHTPLPLLPLSSFLTSPHPSSFHRHTQMGDSPLVT